MWIARDKKQSAYSENEMPSLYLFKSKPCFESNLGYWEPNKLDLEANFFEIDNNLFPELTFENSPQEVEIKLNKSGGIWLARRKRRYDDKKEPPLVIYKDKPISHNNGEYFEISTEGTWLYEFSIGNDLFPEVTFENSPVEVELKIKSHGTE